MYRLILINNDKKITKIFKLPKNPKHIKSIVNYHKLLIFSSGIMLITQKLLV